MTSKKSTGLAAFTRKSQPAAAEAPAVATSTAATLIPGARRRGQGETVALTVRLPRAEWERLHQLAVAEGVSLQGLALLGLSKVFAEKGLPPIKS
jgi:hypothetical protein